MRGFTVVLAVAFLAGCTEPTPADGPMTPQEPAESWMEIQADYFVAGRGCLAELPCMVSQFSTIVAAVLPNTTLQGFDFSVETPAADGYEVDWEVFCVEEGCPTEPLAEGHDELPFEVHAEGLSISGAYLRLRLESTDGPEEKPNPFQSDDVKVEGRALVTYGAPLQEVVREHRLTLSTSHCLDVESCFLSSQAATVDLIGVVQHIELEADWEAASPTEERLGFIVFCPELGCADQFASESKPSPVTEAGEVHMMGQSAWIAAMTNYAGLAGGFAGVGTEVDVVLRTTELVLPVA